MRRALSLIRKRNQILCERAVCALLIWIQNLSIMSGEEQRQPFASDEETISESSRTHYHVWRGTAPSVCQRRGDDLGIFADALSCLERNSPSRLPATRRCIMSGEEQRQPFASDKETVSSHASSIPHTRTHQHQHTHTHTHTLARAWKSDPK
ncbi:uncharacterized protein LOC101863488 isoform X1 [Aplysia californica]|uniref:Uncharacterized protein LOC101863488 isoform X1 n=1 Tax=Aplysia californica TaxID=6500 RepID=A0ABM1W4L8_APLCA|nr:uncharacterized protein LOC101863488 isoform X1 [Aplysia californica]